MIARLLCAVGLHRYRMAWRGLRVVEAECVRCGKRKVSKWSQHYG